MAEKRKQSGNKDVQVAWGRFKFGLFAVGASLVALVVYALTFADYIFPGESAHLFTQWAGMDALELPVHPIWGACIRALGGAAASATQVNALSLVCGVLSAGLLCWLTSVFVARTIYHENTLKYAVGTSRAAGVVAAFAFIFSTAVWQTSTHLDYRLFDLFLALVGFAFLPLMLRWPKWVPALAPLLGVYVAMGLVESEIFAGLLPLYLMTVVMATVKSGRKFYLSTVFFLLGTFIGYLVFTRMVANSFLQLPEAEAAGLTSVLDVWQRCVVKYLREMRMWVGRSGWLYVVALAVLPSLACLFAASRGLNDERRWSQYFFHLAMTFCAILAMVTPLAPASVMRPFGISPVATTTLAAFMCGYLAAYWYLLARTPLPTVEYDRPSSVFVVGRRMAPAVGGLFAVLLMLAALVNAFDCTKDRGRFADLCAGELLDRMGDRTWLVTDGLLDAHLRIVAASRGRELNLVCLHRDMDDAYLKELGALARERKLTAGGANLDISIQLGVLSFLQDWFAGNTNITADAAVFGVPDLWLSAERQPIPECLFFGGGRALTPEAGKKAQADFLSFWKKMAPILPPDGKKGSYSISEVDDPVVRLRLMLRRHIGFVANNLGVMLQDLKLDAEAFEIYELILKDIDCDNVCALFNEFEMARSGFAAAKAHQSEIERKIKTITDNPNRRYQLWALSRYYGYIRSPEIFARMGFAWARSAQTGNAIAQVKRAVDLVPAERQSGLLNMLASIYASGNQAKKSRDVYRKILENDEADHDAWAGLARLSMQQGNLDEAKGYLEKAVKTKSASQEAQGFDWALLHLINNDFASARKALQKITDLQPRSLQGWSLLAGVLLQRYDNEKDAAAKKKVMDELEKVVLPKMESIAATPRDYFVQMTRALIWLRKGPEFMAQARDAMVVAFGVRSDMTMVGNMILELDMAMNDPESAEKHARQVLRIDRTNRLGNYVMGSLRLQRGEYLMAENFLRLAASGEKPMAAAQNDLAEVLQRQDKFAEAERFARAAVKTDPDLYVAWETLGSILLGQKKNLDEAEQCVKKALDLAKEKAKIDDLRMQITLARVQIAKNDLGRARGTLRKIRSRQSELSRYDMGEVDKLQKALQGGKDK